MSAPLPDIPGYNPDRLERWFFNPSGWLTQLLAVSAFVVGILALTRINIFLDGPPILGLFALLAIPAAIGWLGGVQDRCWLYIDHRPPLSFLFHGWKRCLVVPALFATLAVLSSYNIPLRLMLRFGQGTMQQLADAQLAGHPLPVPQKAGLYTVSSCYVEGYGVYLETKGAWEPSYGPRGTEGFVYFRDGQFHHDLQPECGYKRVTDQWYTFAIGM